MVESVADLKLTDNSLPLLGRNRTIDTWTFGYEQLVKLYRRAVSGSLVTISFGLTAVRICPARLCSAVAFAKLDV